MPSSDRSVNDIRYSSFSQPKTEKSDSTVAVLANIVAIPPQKSRNTSNLPSTTRHPASKDVLWSHLSSANLSADSFWYAKTSLLCWRSISAIDSSVQHCRSWLICTERISPNALPRIFASSCGRVGGKSSVALLLQFHSAWISRTPSTTSRTSCPTMLITWYWTSRSIHQWWDDCNLCSSCMCDQSPGNFDYS